MCAARRGAHDEIETSKTSSIHSERSLDLGVFKASEHPKPPLGRPRRGVSSAFQTFFLGEAFEMQETVVCETLVKAK